jgi:hypothetical protein
VAFLPTGLRGNLSDFASFFWGESLSARFTARKTGSAFCGRSFLLCGYCVLSLAYANNENLLG